MAVTFIHTRVRRYSFCILLSQAIRLHFNLFDRTASWCLSSTVCANNTTCHDELLLSSPQCSPYVVMLVINTAVFPAVYQRLQHPLIIISQNIAPARCRSSSYMPPGGAGYVDQVQARAYDSDAYAGRL